MRPSQMMHPWLRLPIVRRLPLFLTAVMFYSLSPGLALAQAEKPRVAVIEFVGVDVSEAEIASATDQLRDNIVNLGNYTVLDRQQTSAVLGEQAFQQEGVTDASKATEIGKLLNVEYIIMGRLTRLRGAYQVNAQMVNVKTGTIARSETYRQRDDFLDLLDHLSPFAASLTQLDGAPQPTPPPEEPALAGEPLPPLPSVQSNAVRPSPPFKKFLEFSAGSFTRELEFTLTANLKNTDTDRVITDTGDLSYSHAAFYFGIVLGPGILRGGVGSFGVNEEEEKDPNAETFEVLRDDTFKDLSGGEFSVDYRGTLRSELAGFNLGYFGSLRVGSLSNDTWEGSFSQFDGGLSAALEFSEDWTFHGAVVLSALGGSLEPTPQALADFETTYPILANSVESLTLEFESTKGAGLLGGFSYTLGERGLLGMELHLGHEIGLAFNATYQL